MAWKFGEYQLNPASYELLLQGAPRPVEPQVFELLALLVANPNRVFTRDELIEEIWHGRIVSDTTVSSRIKAARQAIGDDGRSQNLIRTIHGRGVKFVGDVTPLVHQHPVDDTALSTGTSSTGGQPSTPADEGGPQLSVPDNPSIAVLPFVNMSGDPDQDYFSDGMTEDIITALSRFRWLFVIARASTFQFRDRPENFEEIASHLGVRYVVKGSVRRGGNRIRVTAQLVDATTGNHLWAEHFDRDLVDTFELQDELAQGISGALAPELTRAEAQRSSRKSPDSWEAYDYFLRALPHVYRMTEADTGEALRLLQAATDLDPTFDRARSLASWIYTLRRTQGWQSRADNEQTIAVELARMSLSNDGESDPDVLWQASYALGFFGRDFTQSLVSIDRSLALNPNSSQAWMIRGLANVFSGNAVLALSDLKRAMRLSPVDPLIYRAYFGLALSEISLGEFAKAIQWARRAVAAGPNFIPAHRVLAASLALSGSVDEARLAGKRIVELLPQATIGDWIETSPINDEATRNKMVEGLRLAGLPEG